MLGDDGVEPTPDGPVEPLPSTPARLVAIEIEQHVGGDGWDQRPRLFALVRTALLAQQEPGLAMQLAVSLRDNPDGLTPIEQEDLPPGATFEDALESIVWPDVVDGCAAVIERVMLPPGAEDELPDDPAELAEAVAVHPDRRDVRLVAVVTRDGQRHSAVRGREPEGAQLLEGPDLVPGLVEALSRTLA